MLADVALLLLDLPFEPGDLLLYTRLLGRIGAGEVAARIVQPLFQRMEHALRRPPPAQMIAQASEPGIKAMAEVDILPRLQSIRQLGVSWTRSGMIGFLYFSARVHSFLHSEFGLTLSFVMT